MQKIEIDCSTGQIKYIELSPEEEAKHIQDSQARLLLEQIANKKILKRLLIKSLAELREMKLNKDVFDDNDLAEKQAEIDELKIRL